MSDVQVDALYIDEYDLSIAVWKCVKCSEEYANFINVLPNTDNKKNYIKTWMGVSHNDFRGATFYGDKTTHPELYI